MKSLIKKLTIACLFIFITGIIITGCSSKNITYGNKISENSNIKIKEIQENKDNYSDKRVVLEGKITQICPAGCWFNLNDGTGIMYVNLSGKEYVMEQSRLNSSATVEGKVKYNDSGLSLIPSGIKISK